MSNQVHLQKIANHINQEQKIDLQVPVAANHNPSVSFMVKLLSLFGGVVANVAFVGFLLLFGAFNTPWTTLFIAMVLLGGSYALSRIKDIPFLETLLTSTYLSGTCCFIAALVQWEIDTTVICAIVAILALLSFYFVSDFIIQLLSVVTFFQAILYMVLDIDYTFIPLLILIVCITGTVYLLQEEASWYANPKLNQYYQPLLAGLQITAIYFSFYNTYFTNIIPLALAVYVVISILLFWILQDILKTFFNTSLVKAWYISVLLLALAAFVFYDIKIIISLIFILLAFRYKEILFFIFSILYFIVVLGLFYYDLTTTLLYKSLLLMGSGFLFICFYILLKFNSKNEKSN